MQLTISVEELMKLQQASSEKDAQIAMLQKELEARRAQTGAGSDVKDAPQYISFKLENVCKLLNELKGSPHHVSFLYFCLMKMMPEGMSTSAVQRMLTAASVESLPLNITTTGDMNVTGTYNNVSGNTNVNF